MQLRYLTLCDKWGQWSSWKLEYNNDDEANPYDVAPNDGWEEVPLIEAKRKHREEEE